MYIGTVVPDIKHIKLCRWPWGPKWPPIQRKSRVSSPTGMPWSKHGSPEKREGSSNRSTLHTWLYELYVSFWYIFINLYVCVCKSMYVMYIFFVYIHQDLYLYIFNMTIEFHVMHVVLHAYIFAMDLHGRDTKRPLRNFLSWVIASWHWSAWKDHVLKFLVAFTKCWSTGWIKVIWP